MKLSALIGRRRAQGVHGKRRCNADTIAWPAGEWTLYFADFAQIAPLIVGGAVLNFIIEKAITTGATRTNPCE
jgi:hypothetical protein